MHVTLPTTCTLRSVLLAAEPTIPTSASGFADGLLAGANLVTNAPMQRWDTDWLFDPLGMPGSTATRFGAFLTGVESFDAESFQLAGAEAATLDPHARLLLEHAQVLLSKHSPDSPFTFLAQNGIRSMLARIYRRS